ncbi:hypothetical protein [Dactylosporangium sp. CA-092794]|uniref:hypothetical protein n=1 Tax=Dactylosporangium sp. CA-092794 TaxID=3239929 RepID=UPI003D92FE9E
MSRAQVFVERVPRPEFAAMFLPGGALAGIAGLVRASDGRLDLDFWVDSRANLERASVYCGLAKLVDIYAGRGRRLRLETTGLVRRRLSLPDNQAAWIREEDHTDLAAHVVSLVDRAVPVLPESHTRAGRTLRAGRGRSVLARSFGPRFDDERTGAPWLADITGRVRDALLEVGGIPRNLPPKPSCDALMIDRSGRLLLVDAEAPRSAEVGFAPSRATQNIALWDAWVAADPGALSHLRKMARLREGLGLCRAGTADLVLSSGAPRSTFVLATESSVSAALIGRMEQAAAVLARAGLLDATRFCYELTPPSEPGPVQHGIYPDAIEE